MALVLPERVVVLSQTASDSASIAFTDLSSQMALYRFVIDGLRPATDGSSLAMRVSSDNGSSYIATASYGYGSTYTVIGAVTAPGQGAQATGQTSLLIGGGMSNDTAELSSAEIGVINPGAAQHTDVMFRQMSHFTDGSRYEYVGAGEYNGGATAINGVQFFMTSGNIAAGKFSMQGFRA